MVALIPFGTPFAWGGVAVWLLSQGHTTEGIGLGLWGILVISWVDNLIRPIVISGATKIPFIIIFIGVLGGLTAFGFVGLFIGPVVLAIGLAVWREWISQHKNEIFINQASGFVVADGKALLADTNPTPSNKQQPNLTKDD